MIELSAELEANELLFLSQHRSAVFPCHDGTLFVSSDPQPLTWNFIGALQAQDGDLERAIDRSLELFADWKRAPCMKVTPASKPAGWEEALARSGWSAAVRLSHMVQPDSLPDRAAGVVVRRCRTLQDIITFSEVQSAGFGQPDWFAWVHKINRMNLARPNQHFYLAEVDGAPAGVSLLVTAGRVAGLYAVATLETQRGRGVARALVAEATSEARRLGHTLICLNTAAGGPAQRAFARLGFRDLFESRFFTRA